MGRKQIAEYIVIKAYMTVLLSENFFMIVPPEIWLRQACAGAGH